ncbi:hypothetical protein Taro_045696 [Colocasia esculenta]|uniref:Uncharacterized protein n=1 Tax=Colocasia esculenta TaxID=4460 RepID=A0A843X567_COLES|nr:hypothetical protein [Colocasia esculenta]
MLRTQSKNMKNWSSSVDTSSSSVDTRDRFQKTFWPTWDSVSTLDQVAADTTGKKNGLVWMISCSPATKNISTRPQQVLKLVPRVWFLGLCGPAVRAQTTYWFTVCECDRARCCVLNATALGVTFWVPPFGAFVCMSAACRALGELLTSEVGRRRPPTSRSRRDSRVRRVPNCDTFLVEVGQTELQQALLGQGRGFSVELGRFDVLGLFSAWSRREDVARSRGNAGWLSFFAMFVKDEILEVDKYHWLGCRLVLPVCAVQESSLCCLGIVGGDTLAEEAVETDSERGD